MTNWKRDVSKYNGMRKYTVSDTQNPVVDVCPGTDTAECNRCRVLRSKLIGVTDSLVTALDEHASTEFTVVTHRKRGQTGPAPSTSHQPRHSAHPPNNSVQQSFASVAMRQV